MKIRVSGRLAMAVSVLTVFALTIMAVPASGSGISLTHLPGFGECTPIGHPAQVKITYMAEPWSPLQTAIGDAHSGTEDMSLYQPDRNYEKFHIRRLNGPGSTFTILRADMRRYPSPVDFRGQVVMSNHGSYVMVYEFYRGTPVSIPTCPEDPTPTTTTPSPSTTFPNACPPGSDFEVYTWNGSEWSCNLSHSTTTTTSPSPSTTAPPGGGTTTTTPGGVTTTTQPGGGGGGTTSTTTPGATTTTTVPGQFDCTSNVTVDVPEFFYATGASDPQTVTVTPSSLICPDCRPFPAGPGPQLTSMQITLMVTGTNGYNQYAVTKRVDPIGLGTHSATMVFYVPTNPGQRLHVDVSASGTCAVYDQRSTEIRTINGEDWEVEVYTPSTYPLGINWRGIYPPADVGVIFATAIPRFNLH